MCPWTLLTSRLCAGSAQNPAAFVLAASVSQKYPFVRPVFTWISKPAGAYHPNMGPDGLISADELTGWAPTNSLATIMAALFPGRIQLTDFAAIMAPEVRT